MSFNLFIWICSAISVFVFIAVYLQVKKHIVTPVLRDKDVTIDTSLSAFRESNTYDGIVDSAAKSGVDSISSLFEDMCILNPAKYENDPRIPKVLKDYKDLLHGRIEDPNGRNIPAEILLGIRNVDYGVYLKSQIRALNKSGKDVSWFKNELKRFNKNDKEELFEADFFIMLAEMGAPENLLGVLVNDVRMETYTPEDWKELVEKLKEYDKHYSEEELIYFLESVDSKETLLNENKLESFSMLMELGFDEKLAAAYIENNISADDLENISYLMHKYCMSCEEALERHFKDKAGTLKTLSLQEKYRKDIFN